MRAQETDSIIVSSLDRHRTTLSDVSLNVTIVTMIKISRQDSSAVSTYSQYAMIRDVRDVPCSLITMKILHHFTR